MQRATPDLLNPERIRAAIGNRARDFVSDLLLDVRDECDSTNSVLLDSAADAPGALRVLACERQTAGRGRRGRSWLSWGEGSLTLSVRWHFARGSPAPMGLSLAAGVAVVRALEALGARGIALKWPNDVLVGEAKLGGILVELSSSAARGHAAVIGIGLNLCRDHSVSVDHPIAALSETVKRVAPRSELLAELVVQLADVLHTFSREGFAAFRAEWQAHNAHAARAVIVSGDLGVLRQGTCAGVAEDGALLLDGPLGRERIISGEVSLRSA